MWKRAFILLAFLCLTTTAHAFLYEVAIHSVEEIHQMSDDQLKNAYIEAKIEERASAEFHQAAGFSKPKAYEQHKNLLRYIVHLGQEMKKRDIEIPPVDSWLN